jgi:hypothetical protein
MLIAEEKIAFEIMRLLDEPSNLIDKTMAGRHHPLNSHALLVILHLV